MKSAEIYEIMDWWYALPYDYNNLGELQFKRKQLASLALYIGKELAIKIRELTIAHSQRRIEEAKKSTEYQSKIDPDKTTKDGATKTFTSARAKEKALIDIQPLYDREYKLEGEIEGSKIILKQVNLILQAQHQDIAEMRGVRDDEDKVNSDVGTRFPEKERY